MLTRQQGEQHLSLLPQINPIEEETGLFHYAMEQKVVRRDASLQLQQPRGQRQLHLHRTNLQVAQLHTPH